MPAAGFALSAAIFYVAVKWGYFVPLLLKSTADRSKNRKKYLLLLAFLCFGSGSMTLLWGAPSLSSEFPYLLFLTAIVALIYDKSSVAWTPSVLAFLLNSLNFLRRGETKHIVATAILLLPVFKIALSLRNK